VVVALVAAAGAATLVAGARPAGATVATEIVHDAVGDVVNPRGDIVTAGAGTDAAGYAFTLHVKAPVNPRDDPNWRARTTHVEWDLDTNLDGTQNYFAVFDADSAGNLHAVMERFPDQLVMCTGAARYTATHDYLVTFPVGCIPGIKHFRWSAIMDYDNGTPQNDVAPEVSFAPVITLGKVGYWMLGSDARVYNFGASFGAARATGAAVAISPKLNGSGYWIVDAAGRVFPRGSAQYYGGAPRLVGGEFITTISATPTGLGYWLFSDLGRAFAYGDARPHGGLAFSHLNGRIVASAATPTGLGYYMVGSDGGVFAFGDARFHGSMGAAKLNQPVVGIAPTPDNAGYWLVASDGGVFAFSAPFRGSMGAVTLNRPVNGLVAYGNGYLMVASDGGVFDFSNRKFLGSLAGRSLPAPIVGIAAFTT
jgi:ribosomal protein L24E